MAVGAHGDEAGAGFLDALTQNYVGLPGEDLGFDLQPGAGEYRFGVFQTFFSLAVARTDGDHLDRQA